MQIIPIIQISSSQSFKMNCTYSDCSYQPSCTLCLKRHLHQIHKNCEFCYYDCLEPQHHLSFFTCDCEVKVKPKLKILEALDPQVSKESFRQNSMTCEFCPDLFPYAVSQLFIYLFYRVFYYLEFVILRSFACKVSST